MTKPNKSKKQKRNKRNLKKLSRKFNPVPPRSNTFSNDYTILKSELRNQTFYLFSYGSNNIKELASSNKLNVNESILRNKSVSHWLRNWRRYFFSWSSNRNGSVATIVNTGDGGVAGILHEINCDSSERFNVDGRQIDMAQLCKAEAMSSGKYTLTKVGDYHGKNILAFVGDLHHMPSRGSRYYPTRSPDLGTSYAPSIKYLELINTMLLERRILSGRTFPDLPEIDVITKSGFIGTYIFSNNKCWKKMEGSIN